MRRRGWQRSTDVNNKIPVIFLHDLYRKIRDFGVCTLMQMQSEKRRVAMMYTAKLAIFWNDLCWKGYVFGLCVLSCTCRVRRRRVATTDNAKPIIFWHGPSWKDCFFGLCVP
jgi:hypothetical protein